VAVLLPPILIRLQIKSSVYKPHRGFFVSREDSSTETTNDTWLGQVEPENTIPLSRLIVVIITVALILILAGAPYYNPLAFMFILVFVFGFVLICAYINQELVRSFRGK